MALRAGAARVCITPPLGSELQGHFNARQANNIHDDLWAQAIVLDNGEQRVAFVVCDLIAVTAAITEPARQMVAERCDIPPQNLLISATHTHTGPVTMLIAACQPADDYLASLPGAIADAVAMATARLQPAELGFGTGSCPEVVFNRRYHMKDGSVRFNPGYLNPEALEPAGPTDPTLSLLAVRTADRRPLAALANLSLHYVGAPALDISADYFGFFSRAFQRCAGADLVAVMSNGCQGDINNCDFTRPAPQAPYPYFHTERVANVCAGEAWKTWNTLMEEDWTSDVVLAGALDLVPMRPRRPEPELVAEAREYVANHRPEDDLWKWTYMREYTIMERDWPETMSFPVQSLRVGDVGFVGIPAEPFCEIGLELRRKSPLPHLVPIGLANDCAGYVATDRHYALGGYELTLCRWAFAPEATAAGWIDTAVGQLDRLANGG